MRSTPFILVLSGLSIIGCASETCSLEAPGAAHEPLESARWLAGSEPSWTAALSNSRWTPGAEGLAGPGAVGVDTAALATVPGGFPSPSTHELYARLSSSAASPLWVGVGRGVDARLPMRLEGLAAVPYELADGVAVAREALPSTDVLATTDGARIEVFYRLADASAPTEWRWSLGASPRYTPRQAGESIVLADAGGGPDLRLSAPGAIDAAGTRYAVTASLDGQSVRFALEVPEGSRVTYPLLVDPVVEVFTWSERTPPTSPPIRAYHAMAFDAARGQVLLFGGHSLSSGFSDTWVWDGSSWTERTPASRPSVRSAHVMTFDAARGEVVLFGGTGRSESDTWVWDGSNWTERTPATSPPPRSEPAMAYDAARGEVVLFGGSGRSDTWVWDGSNWTERTPPIRPPGRERHAMAYDAARSEVVLFGGFNGLFLDDTWVWDGSGWTERTPATSPTRRHDHQMAYDAASREVVLFGGAGRPEWGEYDGTWVWNGVAWTERTPTPAPSPRAHHAMAYDEARSELVMFGGLTLSAIETLGDTWVLEATRSGCTSSAECGEDVCVDGECRPAADDAASVDAGAREAAPDAATTPAMDGGLPIEDGGPAADGGVALDAGVPADDRAPAADGASMLDAGARRGADGPEAPLSGGCACRAVSRTAARGAGLSWLGLAVLGASLARRRRTVPGE